MVARDSGVPASNGGLTCNTIEQAITRSGSPGGEQVTGTEVVNAARSALVLEGIAGWRIRQMTSSSTIPATLD